MNRWDKKEIIFFLLIFSLGVFLRLYHLDYPLGLHGDEAWTGIEAKRILDVGSIGLWSTGAFGQSTLTFYWSAIFLKIFGANIITLRFSFALLNILALPFFYLIVRHLFTKQVAIIAFFLFCTSRIFIHFSHVAPTHALFLVGFLPTIFFFLTTLKTKKILFALLCGFFLGISQYFYIGLRTLPVFIATYIIYKSFQKDFIKKYYTCLIVITTMSFIVFLPLGIHFMQYTDSFLARNSVNIFSQQGLAHARNAVYGDKNILEIVLMQTKKTLFMFNSEGDGDSQDNYKTLPVFNFVIGIFFIIGLIVQVRHLKKDNTIFLFLWFLFFLSASIFTVDTPSFRRTQPSIAASYIFTALGIVWTYNVIKKYLPKQMHLLTITFATIISVFVYKDIHMYFVKQAISQETKNTFAYSLVKVANFLYGMPRPIYVYFYSSSSPYRHETLRFMASDIPGEDRSQEFGTYSLEKTHEFTNIVYVFFPTYGNAITEVQTLYPGGKITTTEDADGTILFTSYFLEESTIHNNYENK